MDRQEGKVTFFKFSYGFVESNDRSFFVHIKKVRDLKILQVGDRVLFTPIPGDKQPSEMVCGDVELLERASQAVKS